MHGRGLRSDLKRASYAAILGEGQLRVDPQTVADAMGPPGETAHEREQREARKPCRAFITSGRDVKYCERPNCGFDYAAHHKAWAA